MTNQERPALSIVIPIFNEEENVPILADEIRQAMDPPGIAYEVIAVYDGSTDSSWPRLEAVRAADPRWILVALRRTSDRRLPSPLVSITRTARSTSRSTATSRTTPPTSRGSSP